jgi:hypothetical protein
LCLASACPHCSSSVVNQALSSIVGDSALLDLLRSPTFTPLEIGLPQVETFAQLYERPSFTIHTDAAEFVCPHSGLDYRVLIHGQVKSVSETKKRTIGNKIDVLNAAISRGCDERNKLVEELVKECIAHTVHSAVSASIRQEKIDGRNEAVDKNRKRRELRGTLSESMALWNSEAHTRNGNPRAPLAHSSAAGNPFAHSSAPFAYAPARIAAAADSEDTHAQHGDAAEEDAIDAALLNDSGAHADRAFIDSSD